MDYRDVYSFSRLRAAFAKARRAKRGRGGEPSFYRNLEDNLLELSRELRERTYQPSPYHYFSLVNKKERVVSEASFRDRVVHHALVGAIEPLFEAGFIDWSYACRRGKGTHAALARARKLARRHPYFLKLDISSYFDSIDHGVLMRLLATKIDDPGVLWLCRVLIDGAEVPTVARDEGRGLPIGNLTSQFWANVYLDPLDQMVVRRRGIGTYSRSMDDALVFGSSKGCLWELACEIRCFCRESLGLQLKDRVTVVAPVTEGIPWLGFRVFSGTTRLDHHGKYRFIRNLRRSMAQASKNWHEEERAVAGAASLCGHLTQANTMNLRRSVIDRQ